MTTKPPILTNKQYPEPTVFTAENLLREARRQKSLTRADVPRICVLDPDGDIVRWLRREQGIERDPGWACYHTDLYAFTHEGIRFGIIGCAVGAAFAVLIAEELFASGCQWSALRTSRTRWPVWKAISRRATPAGVRMHWGWWPSRPAHGGPRDAAKPETPARAARCR